MQAQYEYAFACIYYCMVSVFVVRWRITITGFSIREYSVMIFLGVSTRLTYFQRPNPVFAVMTQ